MDRGLSEGSTEGARPADGRPGSWAGDGRCSGLRGAYLSVGGTGPGPALPEGLWEASEVPTFALRCVGSAYLSRKDAGFLLNVLISSLLHNNFWLLKPQSMREAWGTGGTPADAKAVSASREPTRWR